MYLVGQTYDMRCSKCKSVNRFFSRLDTHGRSYRECADCGHNDRQPDPEPSIFSMGSSPLPRVIEF